jgi:hypothetical protein
MNVQGGSNMTGTDFFLFVNILSQGRTAAAQCGLFTHKSVPVIFEPPCTTRPSITYLYVTHITTSCAYMFIKQYCQQLRWQCQIIEFSMSQEFKITWTEVMPALSWRAVQAFTWTDSGEPQKFSVKLVVSLIQDLNLGPPHYKARMLLIRLWFPVPIHY